MSVAFSEKLTKQIEINKKKYNNNQKTFVPRIPATKIAVSTV